MTKKGMKRMFHHNGNINHQQSLDLKNLNVSHSPPRLLGRIVACLTEINYLSSPVMTLLRAILTTTLHYKKNVPICIANTKVLMML